MDWLVGGDIFITKTQMAKFEIEHMWANKFGGAQR